MCVAELSVLVFQQSSPHADEFLILLLLQNFLVGEADDIDRSRVQQCLVVESTLSRPLRTFTTHLHDVDPSALQRYPFACGNLCEI